MLSILDLFTEDKLSCTPESIANQLQVSIPTAYRYLKILMDSGLLQKDLNQEYSLGSRIITLDHLLKTGDKVLHHSLQPMKTLVEKTGFDCVISRLYGDKVIDTHKHASSSPMNLGYGRGRPRPLFKGAAPKVILANMPTAMLQKIFMEHSLKIKEAHLPLDWNAFKKYYQSIRKTGFYLSMGELEMGVCALASPIKSKDGFILGAISMVTTIERMELIDISKLKSLIAENANQIICDISSENL
jgi:DNA-binding IclR family transcriptional regulator